MNDGPFAESDAPVYEWDIVVRRWNTYGDQVESTTPVVIIASTRTEVTTKVRAMFEARYDNFRKFWDHDWTLNSVREVCPTPPVQKGVWRHQDDGTPCVSYPDSFDWNWTEQPFTCSNHGRVMTCVLLPEAQQ